jgi:protein SCO1/2
MASLQKKVKEAGIKNVEYVSFSVDPTVDKPETLKNYGGRFGVDFKNWNFLTGYSQEEIETKAMKEFKMIVKKPQEGDQVIHGTDFFLINQEGKIQKYYTGLQEIPYDEIIDDIKTLQ